MPRTTKSSDFTFQIEVAAPPGWTFAAGDTVIGNVVLRRLPLVSPEATVTLTLFGRAETRITRSGGYNGHGRWHLLAPLGKQLFHGPLHLPQDSNCNNSIAWPFSITIPTELDTTLRRGHLEEDSFLPIDERSIAQQSLPGTFFSSGDGFQASSEGFVEYYLKAFLQYSRGGSPETKSATRPLSIRHPDAEKEFGGFNLMRWGSQSRIQSQKLLPGMQDVPLSFKQKTQQFFGSSKVPELYYTVQIILPRVIQLDNPLSIPFTISVLTQLGRTSADIKDVAQTFRLNDVKIELTSKTRVLAPCHFSPSSYNDTHSCVHKFQLGSAFASLKNPVILSTGKGGGSGNIGDLLQLILHPNGLSAGGRHLAAVETIQPDFVTYNIQHRHTLEWEVSLNVLGEMEKFHGSTGVTILPRA